MNKKRGFGILLFGLSILLLGLIFVSATIVILGELFWTTNPTSPFPSSVDSITINFNNYSEDSGNPSNLIYPISTGIQNADGLTATLGVYNFGCYEGIIKSFSGPVVNGKVYFPWYVSIDDLMKSTRIGESSQFIGLTQYKYYLTINVSGGYGVCSANFLDVYVNWTSFKQDLTSSWLNYTTSQVISDASFDYADLGLNPSGLNSVKFKFSGISSQFNGKQMQVEIWETDLLNDLDKEDSTDDAIRTSSRTLKGIVSNGELIVDLTLTQEDIVLMGSESTYELIGKIVLSPGLTYIGKIVLSPGLTYSDNTTLRLEITGSQEPNILDAVGEWKEYPSQILITMFSWNNDSESDKVIPFSSNIEAPQGTPITIEIYEKDAVGGDDEIRTIVLGNELTGNVNSLGQVYPLWTITQEDLNAAGEQCTANSPCEFYFKIIYGSQEKIFSDKILELSVGQSTCINVNYCTDYLDDVSCNQDSCGVANQTGTIYNIVCSDPGMNCGCMWNLIQGNCNFIFSNQNSSENGVYGSCQYLEQGEDDCNDGILTFSWTGNWSWATGNSFLTQGECENSCGVGNCTSDGLTWHCDPAGAQTQCDSQSNSNSISCPAKVQLPGFNWINVVLIAVALVLIYFLIAWKRKSNKLKKKKRK